MAKKNPDERNAKEAERIATEGLRRMLTTPHTPQRELVGKAGRATKAKNVRKGRR